MPILRVNAEHGSCRLHGSAQPLAGALTRAARGDGPIIVMITGFSYQPGLPGHCPHRLVLGLPPESMADTVPSWPLGLGFGTGISAEGLAIAFGWNARGSIWGARRRAIAAGCALAKLLTGLWERAPHRRMHILAHSMGVEVAASALHHLPPRAISRIVSMTGAAYRSSIVHALDTPAGRGAEFINVVSRANAGFDTLYEGLIAPPQRGDRALGRGLEAPNALTLDLDCKATLATLADLATPIAPPTRRICHWSTYTRSGALACYRAWLREPDCHPLEMLRQRLARPLIATPAEDAPSPGFTRGQLVT